MAPDAQGNLGRAGLVGGWVDSLTEGDGAQWQVTPPQAEGAYMWGAPRASAPWNLVLGQMFTEHTGTVLVPQIQKLKVPSGSCQSRRRQTGGWRMWGRGV